MHALWHSLKGNVHCGSKLSDVVQRRGRQIRRRSCNLERNSEEGELIPNYHIDYSQLQEAIRQSRSQNWFYVLETGDPSRNVIEMIFRGALTCPSRHSAKIKQVLRVNNSMETMERFERFRETIKNRRYEKYKKHPRSMVDGNEQLLFYGTTTTCCTVGKPYRESKLCKDSHCSVCRIIQSGFSTEQNRKMGVVLNMSSQDLSEDTSVITNWKNAKRALIVCRVIAGRVVNRVEGDYEDDYDSIGGGKLKGLIVRNPSAVLPCFVIIF